MNLNELFSDENLGLPVKVRMGRNENDEIVYMYGRYYGRGHDGESLISDDDYYLINIVTPHGSRIKGGSLYYDLIEKKEDLVILEKFEKMEESPYKPYLALKDNKYYKTYEYKNTPLEIKDYPAKWFEDQGFLEIDEDIFGNALSTLFSRQFNQNFYFQKLTSVCEAKPGPINLHVENTRYLSIISTEKYPQEYSHKVSQYPFSKKNYFDNMFKHFPVTINDNDFLIYFGDYSKRKIKLGQIQDGHFFPNNFEPIQDCSHQDEVNYNNPSYDFVQEFINAIIQYKLDNHKMNINQEEIDFILEQFNKMQDSTRTLTRTSKKGIN